MASQYTRERSMASSCRCCSCCCRAGSAFRWLVVASIGKWPRRDGYVISQKVYCGSERFGRLLALAVSRAVVTHSCIGMVCGVSVVVSHVRCRLSSYSTRPQFQPVSTISLDASPHRWPTSEQLMIIAGRQCRSPLINFADSWRCCCSGASPCPRHSACCC